MNSISMISVAYCKPVIYVCNVDDASAVAGNTYVEKVKAALPEDAKY